MRKYCLAFIAAGILLFPQTVLAVSKKELAEAINQLNTRLIEVEKRALTGDPAAVVLQRRLDELEGEVQRLTGELEKTQFDLDKAQDEILDLKDQLTYRGSQSGPTHLINPDGSVGDIERGERPESLQNSVPAPGPYDRNSYLGQDSDRSVKPPANMDQPRGQKTETTGSLPGSLQSGTQRTVSSTHHYRRSVTVQPKSVLTSGADMDFERAKKLLRAHDYAGAESAFKNFLASHSGDVMEPEAHFWLGETLYVRGAHLEAVKSYKKVLEIAKNSSVAPQAMLKMGQSLHAAGKSDMACRVLVMLPKQYSAAGPGLLQRGENLRHAAGC